MHIVILVITIHILTQYMFLQDVLHLHSPISLIRVIVFTLYTLPVVSLWHNVHMKPVSVLH